MVTWNKIALNHSSVPHGWCVRDGAVGGLKLTYSKVVMDRDVTDPKKAFNSLTPTDRTKNLIVRDKKLDVGWCKQSQGIEVELEEWTQFGGNVYVSDGTKIYKLLMSNSHGKRGDSPFGLVKRLSSNKKMKRMDVC